MLSVDVTKNTLASVEGSGLSTKEAGRCKNFWMLGLMYWIYGRPLEPTLRWIDDKFKKRPDIAKANVQALKAGHAYGETVEVSYDRYDVPAAPVEKGEYCNISGNTATAWGLSRPRNSARSISSSARTRSRRRATCSTSSADTSSSA